jgi:hypothetical protein
VIAHVAGLPIEETLAMYGPALLLALGAASARISARFRRARGSRGSNRAVGETKRLVERGAFATPASPAAPRLRHRVRVDLGSQSPEVAHATGAPPDKTTA